jgi:hypothetical protein
MTTSTPPQWQSDRLATLLDALDGVPITDAERRTSPQKTPSGRRPLFTLARPPIGLALPVTSLDSSHMAAPLR